MVGNIVYITIRYFIVCILCVSLARFSSVLSFDINNVRSHETITLEEIEKATEESCILVFVPRSGHVELDVDNPAAAIFQSLQVAFRDEPNVRIAVLMQYEKLPKGWRRVDQADNVTMLFYGRKKRQRSCLTATPRFTSMPQAEEVEGGLSEQLLVLYLNSKCQTFRNLDGSLSQFGKKRADILQNVYHLPSSVMFPDIGSVCKRIDMPSREEFINEYLFKSKPVIIKGAVKNWPALSKWTNQFLQDKFGVNQVHIKLTSDGIFEGCEKAENFSNFKSFHMPDFVRDQLPFPDLVVVRPATMDLDFASFMDMIQFKQGANISAYLEYSSIKDTMPELENDIVELAIVKDILTRRHLNLWLSSGNTLGKLHFDPFENFLFQVSGTKHVTMFEPHDNTMLYEGHIQEGVLGFNKRTKSFSRETLLESTSMVMSPIDILKPDYERFPKFRNIPALQCTISEGDALYMPAFWWHEVWSTPSKQRRNLAVNFWYEPFLTKEFPCAECSLDINSHYLYKLL